MEQRDVERIARGVLADLAAPFSIVNVERTAMGWSVRLKTTGDPVIVAALPDGPASAVRATFRRLVESAD